METDIEKSAERTGELAAALLCAINGTQFSVLEISMALGTVLGHVLHEVGSPEVVNVAISVVEESAKHAISEEEKCP